MAHNGKRVEMNESEIREAMAREWFEHLCETDFRKIHAKYELEDEIGVLRDRIPSPHTINMQITNTILMLRSHVSIFVINRRSHIKICCFYSVN